MHSCIGISCIGISYDLNIDKYIYVYMYICIYIGSCPMGVIDLRGSCPQGNCPTG